jgi:carboxyl-terminal processing protease
LVVADTVLGESVTDKIKVKLAPAGPAPATEDQPVTITRSEAVLREAPVDNALVVGHAPKGTVWRSTGRIGAFQRVEVESGRPAFVAAADVTPGGAVHGTFVPEWQVTPPILTVTAPTVVPGNTVHLKATASDDTEVKDVYIRVWNRDSKLPPKKVFYLPNKGDKRRLSFEADVPLWPGSNLVQVFARETNEIQSVQTVVVLDRGATAVAEKTGAQPAK